MTAFGVIRADTGTVHLSSSDAGVLTRRTDEPSLCPRLQAIAIIPAYNVADSIGATVRAALSVEQIGAVLVVDDGSGDDSAAKAEAAGAELLKLPANKGKGGALNAACAHLASLGAFGAVVLLDGDLGESASEAGILLDALLREDADLAVAQLPAPARKGGIGMVKRLASEAIAAEGFAAKAPLSGQRAIRAERLAELLPFAEGFGVEVAMTIRALRADMHIIEVPTAMTHAATGRDLAGFLHRAKQYRDIRKALRSL